MALTGAQVKQLRSMAHHLNPAIIIGKSDVNEGTVEQTVAYPRSTSSLSAPYSMAPVFPPARPPKSSLSVAAPRSSVIGRKFSLYRESSRKDIEKIKLV